MKITFKAHLFFYICALICFLTGNFKYFTFVFIITLFHELGHIISAIIFNWKIERVVILPFGFLTIFNEHLNKQLKEEFIVTISGPLFQLILFFLIKDDYFTKINLFLLIFNLLPILPLDGSKLTNIFFNLLFSYLYSKYMSVFLSIFTIISIIYIQKFELIYMLIYILLILEIAKDFLKIKYYFNKFLLERYITNFNFKRVKKINNIKYMKKGYKHVIKTNNVWVTERQILSKMFDKR